MEKPDRRQQIRSYLGLEPISHGQIHTFQIAVPESQKHDISIERYQALADSLTNHKTNLIPLIVRQTEAYSEEEEYEVVYGSDWCIVAKEINIEKLWVWFFDMNDEQAAAAKAEMEQLENVMPPDTGSTDIESLLDKKLRPVTAKIDQVLLKKPVDNEGNLPEEIRDVKRQIEELKSTVNELANLVKERLSAPKPPEPPKPPKLNLRIVTEKEIKEALSKVKATSTQIKAAWNAIQYWKKTGKSLTWENLEKSTKSGSDKVTGFAKPSYEKLKEIADIPDEDVT
ncbi:hypothetical protein [Kamptonema sp. UHCC 0994]|uniref:hypothetical protein n=1 Tax=Kamptonema sp. UHCC 0994 TaxID=3031329 RepID=UPI0023BB0CE8|nr:hypothetical protein [Kamptonema sp. UHCC 0994]MDF0556801.1 hypothetical protein [Kamptonema sp. UHCC 0994]